MGADRSISVSFVGKEIVIVADLAGGGLQPGFFQAASVREYFARTKFCRPHSAIDHL